MITCVQDNILTEIMHLWHTGVHLSDSKQHSVVSKVFIIVPSELLMLQSWCTDKRYQNLCVHQTKPGHQLLLFLHSITPGPT